MAGSISAHIASLQRHPAGLDGLSPRLFEEIVAELLASFGWDVSLTSVTRDGGLDILGVSRDRTGFETTWAVQCKHYRADRKVGVEIVRALYGVSWSLGVNQAVLVTSSGYTDAARQFAQRERLQLVDRTCLLKWIADYSARPGTSYLPERRFRSCFVSHSSKDDEFAAYLVSRLRAAGIRVWFAVEDLKPGEKVYDQIADAIEGFDRLLVILSEHSTRSSWVATEIRKARDRERKENARVLFPVSLMPFDRLRAWELFDADSGRDLAAELREYFIPDFSEWRHAKEFQQAFERLLEGLELPLATRPSAG